MATRIPCPSESWDLYEKMQEEEQQEEAEQQAVESLDAYGHLAYCVGWNDDDAPEDSDRGDWLACFDFAVFVDGEGDVKVAYHTIVNSDSGGFIDTLEQRVVDAAKAPYNLPDYWRGIGESQGVVWTDAEIDEALRANSQWNADLKAEIEKV